MSEHNIQTVTVLEEGKFFDNSDVTITKEDIENEFKNYEKHIDQHSAYGCLYTEKELRERKRINATVELRYASHLVIDQQLYYTSENKLGWKMIIKFLDTERGKILKEAFKECNRNTVAIYPPLIFIAVHFTLPIVSEDLILKKL